MGVRFVPNPLNPIPATPASDSTSIRARRVEMILQRVDALPTLAPVANRLLRIASLSDPELSDIIELIESDPSLTSKVLSLSRRASLGLGGRITSVRQAAVMLGLDAIQAAVLSLKVFEVIDESRAAAANLDDVESGEASARVVPFDYRGFWRHCIAVACAAEQIAELHSARGVRREEAFVAGLIHDLGKPVLHMLLPRAYSRVLGLIETQQSAAAPIERAVLGLDHHTAGKRLAEHWSLPHPLLDVMWLHSQPYASLPDLPHKALIAIVTAAKALCRSLHLGWSGESSPIPDVAAICRDAALDVPRVQGCASRLIEAVAVRCEAIGLDDIASDELLLESIANANTRLGVMASALQVKARDNALQSRILDAIAAFHAGAARSPGVLHTFSLVVQSAIECLGTGFHAIVFQSRPNDPWQVCEFSPQGDLVRSDVIEAPTGRARGRHALAALNRPSQVTIGSLGLLPWLEDYLHGAADMREVRLLPLGAILEDEGPACLLLHDRPLPQSGRIRASLDALTASWGAAVSASNQHDGARRLGEHLAEATRALVETQSRLEDAQVMVKLGQLAAGAAHEMNNPLTIISGRSQQLLRDVADPKLTGSVKAIAEAAEKLADLITTLHTVADPPSPKPTPTLVADLAQEAVRIAQERTGTAGRVSIDLSPDCGRVVLDPALCVPALVELITNALEASPKSSVIVRAIVVEEWLEVTVKDDGPGLSTRALHHAFDPFFSEKPAGRKTGMGLTRGRRLIEVHGGIITLNSTPGSGTTATIRLPVRERSDRDGLERGGQAQEGLAA